MIENLPVLGICGYSGAGKTTLIEELIYRLTGRGLKIGVVKHDVHGLRFDEEGKDSDRLFTAGADVLMRGPEQGFLRTRRLNEADLPRVLRWLTPHYDLILVEGHKTTPLPKRIWLKRDALDTCPAGAPRAELELGRDADRAGAVMNLLGAWLEQTWLATKVYAGLLIGGKSYRMGRKKHLIEHKGRTWLELAAAAVKPFAYDLVILGGGEIPPPLRSLTVLPDVHDARGPLSGMLAAMRWRPLVSWLFVACDMPFVSRDAVEWLLSTRRPGVWATVPRLAGANGVEPLLAHYDFRSHHLLENLERPADIAGSPNVISPCPPGDIADAWMNINAPQDIGALTRLGPSSEGDPTSGE